MQHPKNRVNPRSLTGMILLVNTLAGCSQPPPPAAAHPYATPAQRPAIAPEERCGLVRRAKSTWVGFGPGMTLDDMVPAGYAAAAVVRAIDAAVCGLVQRGRRIEVLQPHGLQLKAQAADGGGFEVTSVVWQDAELIRASVELRKLHAGENPDWLADVVRRGDAFQIATFGRAIPAQ